MSNRPDRGRRDEDEIDRQWNRNAGRCPKTLGGENAWCPPPPVRIPALLERHLYLSAFGLGPSEQPCWGFGPAWQTAHRRAVRQEQSRQEPGQKFGPMRHSGRMGQKAAASKTPFQQFRTDS